MAENRVTQVMVEVVDKPSAPDARVTQAAVEVLYTRHPPADVSQMVLEALVHTTVPADVSQFVLEVLRKNTPIVAQATGRAYTDN